MVLTQILDWVSNIGLIFLAVAVMIWGLKFKKLPKAIQYIGFYLLSNLLIQLGADFLWQRSLNNLPLLHLNTLLEFVLISFFFREVFIDKYFFKKYFYAIIGTAASLLILNSLFLESIYTFNIKAKILVQIWLVGYVVIYFFDAYGRVDLSERVAQSISLISFAILIYYAGSLSTYLFSEFYSEEIKEGIRPIWIINGLLTAIFQLILLIVIARLAFKPQKLHN